MINGRVVLLLFNLILQIEEITAKLQIKCTDEIIEGDTILTRKGKQPDCKCVSDTGTDEKCPKDAVLKDDFCYVWPKNKLTYLAGRTLCQGMKGSIFGPKRRADVTFMYSKGETDRFWNGINDMKTEGKWVYEDGSPVTWSMWYPGEPNGAKGGKSDEDCGVTSKTYWFDYGCASKMKFVCRIPTQIITDDRFTCVKSKGQNTEMKIQHYYGPSSLKAEDGHEQNFTIDQSVTMIAHVVCVVDKYEYNVGEPNVTVYVDGYGLQTSYVKTTYNPENMNYNFRFAVERVNNMTRLNGTCKAVSAASKRIFLENHFVLELKPNPNLKKKAKPKDKEPKSQSMILTLVIFGLIFFLVVGGLFFFVVKKKRRRTHKEPKAEEDHHQEPPAAEKNMTLDDDLQAGVFTGLPETGADLSFDVYTGPPETEIKKSVVKDDVLKLEDIDDESKRVDDPRKSSVLQRESEETVRKSIDDTTSIGRRESNLKE